MPRVLVIQHDHVSPIGPIGERFAERGHQVELFGVVPRERFTSPDVEVALPDPIGYDVIVPMGAPWSVYDHDRIGTWIAPELDLLRRAQQHDVPVLGICFGGQALAAALGGSVQRAEVPEIGWYTVDSDDPGLIEPGPWFEWHFDRWSAPAGATSLARTDAAEQAFVIGRSLAVQFHPELTPDMLQGWLDNGGDRHLAANGVDGDTLTRQTRDHAEAARRRAHTLVDRFLDRVVAGR